MKKYFIYGVVPALILLCFVIFVLSIIKLPNYANYTGIRPIETKMKLIQDFEHKNGKIDAVVFGSSIVDYGFSAELFSKLMSEYHGKKYNVFNFSTGAAEPRTLPILYKIMRESVDKIPEDIYVIMPVEPKLSEELALLSPDYTLNKSPVSKYLDNEILFKVQFSIHNSQIFKNIPGIRDLLLNRGFDNLEKNLGSELYYLNEFGDRINYAYNKDFKRIEHLKETFENSFILNENATSEDYFANRDILAMKELEHLVEQDGSKLIIVPHAPAYTMWHGNFNSNYIEARSHFYSKYPVNNSLIIKDFIPLFEIPEHYIADETHLNTYGAYFYTKNLYDVITNNLENMKIDECLKPDLNLISSADDTFNNFSVFVKKEKFDESKILKFKIVDSYSVPALPKNNLFVALRTSDNEDKIVPMIHIKNHEYYIKIDLPISNKEQFFIFRVLYGNETKRALNAPVAQYVWTTEDNLEKDY